MKKRGIKTCPSCNTSTGVRSYNCKKCDYEFPMKIKKRGKRKIRFDKRWKELKKGDRIKVLAGSGSYYLDKETGDKIYLGERGEYIVREIDKQGILAYGASLKNKGYCYLYMGPKKKSPLCDSLWRNKHKIILIKERGNSSE